jgi:hypothetical protein
MLSDFSKNKLGDTQQLYELDSSEAHQQAVILMANQGRKTLEIVSRELDPQVYDDQRVADALKQLALYSRYSKIRILVFETTAIAKRGHRLLDLAMKLPSFIEIRKPGKEHRTFNQAFLIADGVGYIHQPDAARYEAQMDFKRRKIAGALQKTFDDMWDKSEADMNLRRLNI